MSQTQQQQQRRRHQWFLKCNIADVIRQDNNVAFAQSAGLLTKWTVW